MVGCVDTGKGASPVLVPEFRLGENAMPFQMVPDGKLALNWTYFRKVNVSPDGDKMSALTACSTEPSRISVDSKSTPGVYKVAEGFMLTVRVTQDSWVVKSAIASESESKRLINHERTHFLLASCVAFDLYQQILDAKETSSARLQAKLTELRRKAAKRAQDMSDEYDDDTLHGDIAIAQRNWDLRIERWDREQSE
jgi:hypothetical protein